MKQIIDGAVDSAADFMDMDTFTIDSHDRCYYIDLDPGEKRLYLIGIPHCTESIVYKIEGKRR